MTLNANSRTTTPDFQLALQSQLQTPMDDLDFESLLGGLGGTASADGYEDFLAGMQNQDPGAIFMPADTAGTAAAVAAATAGVVGPQGGGEWIDNMSGTTSPGSARIGQWVCIISIKRVCVVSLTFHSSRTTGLSKRRVDEQQRVKR